MPHYSFDFTLPEGLSLSGIWLDWQYRWHVAIRTDKTEEAPIVEIGRGMGADFQTALDIALQNVTRLQRTPSPPLSPEDLGL